MLVGKPEARDSCDTEFLRTVLAQSIGKKPLLFWKAKKLVRLQESMLWQSFEVQTAIMRSYPCKIGTEIVGGEL